MAMKILTRPAALLAALLLSAVPAAAVPIQEADFTATDYAFSGPASLPAGPITLRVVNKGHELHHLTLVKLPAGKSADDLRAAFRADPGHLPAWAAFMGGPNAAMPGQSSAAVIDLDPGAYAVICYIPNTTGVPHVVDGMIAPLTVDASAAPKAASLPATAVINPADFSFDVPTPLTKGLHTISITNKGSQTHEVVVVLLEPGAHAADFAAAFAPGASGPPPGKAVGGMSPLKPGGTGLFLTNLEPGNYALLCFLPDPASGKPHFALGMTREFTVKP